MWKQNERLGKLGVWAFIGMSFFAGFIGGREIPKSVTPQSSPPPIIYVVDDKQDFQDLYETVRDILKSAADKKISVEQAVMQLSAALRITLSNIAVVDEIRPIVQRLVDTATNPDIDKATAEALKLRRAMSKPVPSPIPTATIVISRPR